jgi:hypothetical protein
MRVLKIVLLASLIILVQNGLSFSQTHEAKGETALVYPKRLPKTITVGGTDADISGFTSVAIQTAIDALSPYDGGTVKLTAGTFEIIAPVRLTNNTSLIGSGPETVLRKGDGFQTNFIDDADYGELKITVADPTGFVPGMGVQIYDAVQMEECWNVTTAVITAIEENVVYIDRYLVRDYRAEHDGIISNAASVVAAVEVDNVHVASLTVDGNREKNEFVNGCVGGGVYLHKVKKALVENVTVRDWHGDGISWQITEEVTVRNCEVSGCNFGLHPGTGSPFSLIEGNNSHDNDFDGLFVCWRVQDAVVRNNKFHHNGQYGICTGHKDTDILYENNHIYENGSDGVNLREENDRNAPHRSIFRNNIVENNGQKSGGYGFSFESPAKDVLLEANIIRDTGMGTQKAALFSGQNALDVSLKNNKISGHPEGRMVSEKAPAK